MKKAINDFSAKQKEELQSLAALPEEEINTEDIPEVRDWSDGKRGMFYRPLKSEITLEIDADLLEWLNLNQHQADYQTIINDALRQYVRQHQLK